MVHLIVCSAAITAEQTAQLLTDNVFKTSWITRQFGF